MNTVKPTTLSDRLKNATNAFRGKPIGSIQYGIDIKRCSECDYKPGKHRYNPVAEAYNTLMVVMHLDKVTGTAATYDELTGAIEEAIGYLGEALE